MRRYVCHLLAISFDYNKVKSYNKLLVEKPSLKKLTNASKKKPVLN